MRRLAACLLLVGVLAACGDDDDDAASTTTSTTERTTTTTEATTSTTAFGGTTDKTTSESAEGSAVLIDVRVGAEGTLERAVFEFRAELPGYTIEYVEPPITQDGSGETVAVEGEAFLLVTMQPATSFDFEAGESAYDGPDRVTGGTTLLTEAVAVGDFESYLSWAIGLERRVPYRVVTLEHRLVIELDAS